MCPEVFTALERLMTINGFAGFLKKWNKLSK